MKALIELKEALTLFVFEGGLIRIGKNHEITLCCGRKQNPYILEPIDDLLHTIGTHLWFIDKGIGVVVHRLMAVNNGLGNKLFYDSGGVKAIPGNAPLKWRGFIVPTVVKPKPIVIHDLLDRSL